jgi:hypothetical protein
MRLTEQEQQEYVERNQPMVKKKLDEPVLAIEAPAGSESVVCDTGKAAIIDHFLGALSTQAEAA